MSNEEKDMESHAIERDAEWMAFNLKQEKDASEKLHKQIKEERESYARTTVPQGYRGDT